MVGAPEPYSGYGRASVAAIADCLSTKRYSEAHARALLLLARAFLKTKKKLDSRVAPSYPSDPDEKVPKGSGKGPKGKDKEKNKDKETPAK